MRLWAEAAIRRIRALLGIATVHVSELIHSVGDEGVDDIANAALAIRRVGPSQLHIGILHRSRNLQFLHLAWHNDLRNGQPPTEGLWIEVRLPEPRLRQVCAICRQVWRANETGLPYGFSSPTDCFDETTQEYLYGPTRLGLTCSSFVLAVFERAGLPLARYGTWPAHREGDVQWQVDAVDRLRWSASQAHIDAVSRDIGAVRYRPEDVAGAAASPPYPAHFRKAAKIAKIVLARL